MYFYVLGYFRYFMTFYVRPSEFEGILTMGIKHKLFHHGVPIVDKYLKAYPMLHFILL